MPLLMPWQKKLIGTVIIGTISPNPSIKLFWKRSLEGTIENCLSLARSSLGHHLVEYNFLLLVQYIIRYRWRRLYIHLKCGCSVPNSSLL